MAELNGAPITPEELQTLALINYGHFTSMRIEGGRVRGLSHHLERLARDCRRGVVDAVASCFFLFFVFMMALLTWGGVRDLTCFPADEGV